MNLVHDLFVAKVAQTPDAIALVGARRQYSYAELHCVTSDLARRLREVGVGPEVIVGCWSRNSVSTVIQVLSVLKAGGAYLLLDPALPAERLLYMLADADPLCILSDREPPKKVVGDRTILCIDDVMAQRSCRTGSDFFPAVTPQNLAYVAYTSGSTGRPKGVLSTHAAVVNHAQSLQKILSLRPGDRLPLMASTAFDVATEEMIPPLLAGCTLLDAPVRSPSLQAFTDDVLRNHYTILNLPAPLWHQWTTYLRRTDRPVPPKLRLVIVGSDKIYTGKFREWLSLRGAEKVWWVAAYGVTEATVTSLLYLDAARDDLTGEPLMPIGKPLPNVEAHVVREDGSPAEQGGTDVGELHIGGVGLARGYLNLPDKTVESFIDDHFSGHYGSRLYRTGDLVRQRCDGVLVWLGRKDSQIKINGLRIEPAEIEAVIHEHPSVHECVVVFVPPTELEDTGKLVVYAEASENEEINIPALFDFLRARLHPLMLPSRIVVLDSIPVNVNGKIDRTALRNSRARARV